MDESELIHSQAWAVMLALQKKKSGRSVYKYFKQFFNKEKSEQEALGKGLSSRDKLKNFIAKYNSQ